MVRHISFVALQAYGLLDERARQGIGGAEVRAVTFARGLQQLTDCEIEFIVSSGPDLIDESKGIRIRPYQRDTGSKRRLRRIRHALSHPFSRRPLPDSFYEHLDTNLLCCFGLRNDSASIISAARRSGKRSLLFLTSDRNIEDAQRRGRHDRGVYGERGDSCRYALRNADVVIAQTPFQQMQLQRTLQIPSTLIRNPIDLNSTGKTEDVPSYDVLWIGRADTFSKRADLCIELARRCPAVQFVMIMNNHDESTFQKLSASATPNVRIVEHVPFAEVETYFQLTKVLVNTSAAEGFPNSFLQAAKHAKPIVSLSVDPASMLTQHRCGVFCDDDIELMAQTVRDLLRSPTRGPLGARPSHSNYEQYANNAYSYVRRYHDAQECVRQLADVILKTSVPAKAA